MNSFVYVFQIEIFLLYHIIPNLMVKKTDVFLRRWALDEFETCQHSAIFRFVCSYSMEVNEFQMHRSQQTEKTYRHKSFKVVGMPIVPIMVDPLICFQDNRSFKLMEGLP